ncbi:MAG: preprotein translocase subunit SecA [Piscirickettsiaceae bacterium]|nr:preprotein translocase subunit SecA [Piscirickettsiaceae bacterium]
MAINFFSKIFGSRNDRVLRNMRIVAEQITEFESNMETLSDVAIQNKIIEFRQRLSDGESLGDILPEAFAVVREGGKRVLHMRHFDVQMIGGMVLNQGRIAEMRTGEGKTLVATLTVYLNALVGRGVHVVTVNDYLAQRDSAWMSKLYSFLGLTIGVIFSGLASDQRRAAYAADITYGTNNEFGFDYLRDNMAFSLDEKVQRELYFAVIDEVDSILIDEARTPLIISGSVEDSSKMYQRINTLIPNLSKQIGEGKKIDITGDYIVDEKRKQVHLTEDGHEKIEVLLMKDDLLDKDSSLYDSANISLMHYITAALRAHVLFKCDVDYIIQNDQVIIVDEFTGRTMLGRRWSEGLHQAVEAKEGVAIQKENQTLASITFQNYFRLYEKLSGMTGTADTEAFELQAIYGLEVIVIPTHRPMRRKDEADKIYLTTKEKYEAIITDIKGCIDHKKPVLVGTSSIESSEYLHALLEEDNVPHEVLNAKFHKKEAQIITHAGRPGAVTVATNMAGRGTDIVLGGSLNAELENLGEQVRDIDKRRVTKVWRKRHDEVLSAGGLHIIGSERHESRRIDNQLRGRSGRQGDVGSSRFYLSLEDDLMRIFSSERMAIFMQKLGMERGESIEHPWVSRAIENAQRKVEGHNFDIRKQLLEFDDVANDQRRVVYEQRNELIATDNVSETIISMRNTVLNDVISMYVFPKSMRDQWNISGLEGTLQDDFFLKLGIVNWLVQDAAMNEGMLRQRIIESDEMRYENKEQMVGSELMRHFEKATMLQILDVKWKEHLAQMDYLRQGINLRGYAQKDPKQEFKREAFQLFTNMLSAIKYDVIIYISRVQVPDFEDMAAVEERCRQTVEVKHRHDQLKIFADKTKKKSILGAHSPYIRNGRKVGRNEICPCGSGKKFKQCHGSFA